LPLGVEPPVGEPGVAPVDEVVGVARGTVARDVGAVVGVDRVVVGVVPPTGAGALVTVKVLGAYVATSEGNPSVKQVATTTPGTAGAVAGTAIDPLHDPFAETGMFVENESAVDVTVTWSWVGDTAMPGAQPVPPTCTTVPGGPAVGDIVNGSRSAPTARMPVSVGTRSITDATRSVSDALRPPGDWFRIRTGYRAPITQPPRAAADAADSRNRRSGAAG
jgi:hypothetical protein